MHTRSAVETARSEILRQASVALRGRDVGVFEAVDGGSFQPLASSTGASLEGRAPDPAILTGWGISPASGRRWVACRTDGGPGWRVAPVRALPAAPPPDGIERRSHERMVLELAGLCFGLIGDEIAPPPGRLPSPAILTELGLHPTLITHELAGLLTAASVNLRFALERLEPPDTVAPSLRIEVFEDLTSAAEGVSRAIEFLRSVQNRIRGVQSAHERFDAVHVVRSGVDLERGYADKNDVILELKADLSPRYLRGDPNAFYRVVTNLVRNALEASSGGTTSVSVVLEETDEGLMLTVEDRGIGITGEHLTRIFEPGFTTKGVRGGSGIGLNVVREAVQNVFAGTIRVTSEPGLGTTVIVQVPLPAQREEG